MKCKPQYKKELDIINEDIKTLETNLIKGLKTVGIEYLDLQPFITKLEVLTLRKDKIQYLIALDN